MPQDPLESRYTRQWGDIGFQGKDPATDFRGMGLLGLEQLHYLAERHTATARQILVASQHPRIGFPLAIVAISITADCVSLVRDRLALAPLSMRWDALLVTTDAHSDLEDFHELFCALLQRFVAHWRTANPPDVMSFGPVSAQFRKETREQLRTGVLRQLALDLDA